MLRIDRHRLGPRVYVLGARIHEWHVGAGLLLLLALGGAFDRVHPGLRAALPGMLGLWLVAKDWRDLVPSRRDTAAWRLGLHAVPAPLRTFRRADPLPKLAALGTGLAGFVNLASAVTPNIGWRDELLLRFAPLAALRVSHAAAVPASLLLLAAAPYLWRRRVGAHRLAVALLIGLGLLNLLKGLDLEEAAASFALAAMLWAGRGSFYVRHDRLGLRTALVRVPLVVGTGLLFCGLAVWLAAPESASAGALVRETFAALLWQPGPLHFADELGLVDEGVGLTGVLVLAASLWMILRPLAAPRTLPDVRLRQAAARLVRRHGSDTLAYFKLRRDQHYLFTADGRAFLGYRVEAGVLLVSGDPVGPDDAIPGLLRELSSFAEARGLRIAALGAGERLLPFWRQLGLRTLYLGDEALVDTRGFSLEGRAIRKVRQSVSRLEKAGYTAELSRLSELDEQRMVELDLVSRSWRGGTSERGFAMSLDALRREDHGDSLVVVSADGEGGIRGFLHFAPTFGRSAVSLSLMRRDRDTLNGLTEFMIVRAIELLRDRGVDEVSLNFSVFARVIHEPRGTFQRALGRVLLIADAYFQIERLYRFNAKFFPRWEPRYVVYESRLALPRIGLASMWAEGQLPKPGRR